MSKAEEIKLYSEQKELIIMYLDQYEYGLEETRYRYLRCNSKAFKSLSYQSFVVEELKRLMDESGINDNPISIIENYILKMDKLSLLNRNTSFIFSTAYDTALDIFDNLVYSSDGIFDMFPKED